MILQLRVFILNLFAIFAITNIKQSHIDFIYNIIKMTLLERYFAELMQCTGMVYLTIAMFVALIKSPSIPEYKPYRLAKKLLAGSFASMALNLFLWCIFTSGNWNVFNYNIAVADIILFFLEYMLLCNSYCILLNKDYATKKRIITDLSLWVITSALSIGALLKPLSEWRSVMLLVALAMLIAYIFKFIITFYQQYRHNKTMLDNYFSDDMQRFARWISRSLIMCIISWFIAIMSMFGNIYFNWIYQFYVITLNIYIAISFINYAARYGDLAKADSELFYINGEPKPAESASDSVERITLETKLKQWLDTKKYLTEQFTLEDLAIAIGTNKNYLSYHINEKYGVSFSSWISDMRIDEAKRLMITNPERKLENIAYSVGFSSASYFSKVFSLHEGISPARWRKDNM